jgi:hypothetical protein
MRTVSQVELKRLKKKGKVRKKMGAQPTKKPEPVATVGEGMSGSVPTELPTPALTPVPVEQTASMSASMEYRDGLLEGLIENNTKAIDTFRLALTEQKPRAGISYRHKVNRDVKTSLIDEVISTPMEAEA